MKAVAGQVLGGRYLLEELLATGGMGEVWSAQDQAVGRTVAIKVLRDEYTGNMEFLRRLRTEARNSAALAHPNIAQMFDYGEEAGTGYLVMELVPGESLADLLDRRPVLPTKELLPILADTARGLEHAHRNSVVHRDVKPGNILLENTLPGVHPKVKITDFGVSLAANQAPMTATGMVMGTAQYLSPEQAIGQPATPRSDLYGLGVIAYEAAVGKRPFSGKSPVDIAIAHVNDPMPPLPDSVDPALAAVITRLLEKDPQKRYATAGELAAELDALASPNKPRPPTMSIPAVATPSSSSGPLASPQVGGPLMSEIGRPPAGGAVDLGAPGMLGAVEPGTEGRVTPVGGYPSRAARRAALASETGAPQTPYQVTYPGAPDQQGFGATDTPIAVTAAPLVRRSVRRPISPVASQPPRRPSVVSRTAEVAPVESSMAPGSTVVGTTTAGSTAVGSMAASSTTADAGRELWPESNPMPPPSITPTSRAVAEQETRAGIPKWVWIALLIIALLVGIYLIVRGFASNRDNMDAQSDIKVSMGEVYSALPEPPIARGPTRDDSRPADFGQDGQSAPEMKRTHLWL